MIVPYTIDSSSSHYKNYYANQAGGGMPVFRGKTVQHGSGLGGVFSKIFKGIAPMFKNLTKTAGKQLITTGANIAKDVLSGKKLADSTKSNFTQGGKQLFSELVTSFAAKPKVGGTRKRKSNKVKKTKPKTKHRRLENDIFQRSL